MDISYLHKIKGILATHGVRFAYLFGSRAGLHALPSSDFDVAVSLKEASSPVRFAERLRLQDELGVACAPRHVDVIVLNDTHSATLRYEIASKGKLIYDQDTSGRIDFELRALKEYEDFAPFLSRYNQMYQKANT